MTFELPQNGSTVEFKHLDNSILTTGCQQLTIATETATVGCLVEARDGFDYLIGSRAVHLDLNKMYNLDHFSRMCSDLITAVMSGTYSRATGHSIVVRRCCSEVDARDGGLFLHDNWKL